MRNARAILDAASAIAKERHVEASSDDGAREMLPPSAVPQHNAIAHNSEGAPI